jgi:hypothetical protein
LIDHEKAVDELRGLRRKGGETPAQLAWRIEKLMAKAYLELCASTHGSAKKTKEQMLHDTFLGAIDNAMSRKIKSDSKHRDLNLTQLSEEVDRLELVYKTTAPKVNLEVNNFKTTGEADEISLRKIIREEVAAALSKENDGSRETEDETKRTVGFVGKRNFPPKPRSGKNGKNQGCFHCQSPEHSRKDCPFRDLCQRCWQKGHTAPSCHAPSPRPSPSLNSKAAGNNRQQK